MEFWASCEAHKPAYEMLSRVRREVEARLNAELSHSILATQSVKFRYVPIVMPEDMQDRYPARSRPLPKQGIYDCAPQLDYEIFVSESYGRCVDEYLSGVVNCIPSLAEIGMKDAEINLFGTLVGKVRDSMISEHALNQASPEI